MSLLVAPGKAVNSSKGIEFVLGSNTLVDTPSAIQYSFPRSSRRNPSSVIKSSSGLSKSPAIIIGSGISFKDVTIGTSRVDSPVNCTGSPFSLIPKEVTSRPISKFPELGN